MMLSETLRHPASAIYAYAEENDAPSIMSYTNTSLEAHYETCTSAASEETYWKPSSQEDELTAQLSTLGIDDIPGGSIQ